MSGLSQELASEKSQTTELQKALEQSQESHTKLQSDFYGKESEVSALHQDLKVGPCKKPCVVEPVTSPREALLLHHFENGTPLNSSRSFCCFYRFLSLRP